MPVIPALRRQRRKTHMFKASLDYVEDPASKKDATCYVVMLKIYLYPCWV
jgi:hypothetical protein